MLLSNYIPRSFSSVKSPILGHLFNLKILCIHNVNMMAQVNGEFYWKVLLCFIGMLRGFTGGTSGKEPTCQCGRHERQGFHPWVGKIPWMRAWQPTQDKDAFLIPKHFPHAVPVVRDSLDLNSGNH